MTEPWAVMLRVFRIEKVADEIDAGGDDLAE
jgi:hypothetical protein